MTTVRKLAAHLTPDDALFFLDEAHPIRTLQRADGRTYVATADDWLFTYQPGDVVDVAA